MSFTADSESELFTLLKEKMSGKSVNNIKSILTRKQVYVDGKPVSQYNFIVNKGSNVLIKGKASEKSPACKLKIIYEDDEIIVINKPHGLLTVATEKEKDKTAYHFVMNYIKADNPNNRIFIVHRLDKDTSGVVMFAKNPEIKEAFQDNWSDLVKEREYIAVVEGKMEKNEGKIESYLTETKTHLVYSTNNKIDGKLAITNYKVLNKNDEYSLLQVSIDTGRKNQIRAHMKELGHPVAGDKKYSAETNPFNRMALHCSKLVLLHPITHQEMSFAAAPDARFYSMFK